jgi:dihydrofolate reductase
MRKLIYAMNVSLDGYIKGPDGTFDWAPPDEEVHRFWNEQTRQTGVELYGRNLYETMKVWETLDQEPDATDVEVEFAELWRATPKIVFSTTLTEVEGSNTTLEKRDVVDVVEELKGEEGEEIAVGGAGLASTLVRAGLVDEYRVCVNPALAGGGTPFFPPLDDQVGLELVETRTFGSRVVYLRYRVLG